MGAQAFSVFLDGILCKFCFVHFLLTYYEWKSIIISIMVTKIVTVKPENNITSVRPNRMERKAGQK